MRTHPTKFSALLITLTCLAATSCGGSSKSFSLAKSGEKDLSECMALAEKNKNEQAIKCLEAYKSRHFGDPAAAEAELAIADAYFAEKDYLVAAEAYNLFAESYPSHSKAPYALYRSGVAYLKEAPKTVDRDQTYLESAQRQLETVAAYYSASPYAADAREFYDVVRHKIAKNHYYVGRFYYKYEQYLAAIPRFQTIITEYPQLGLDEKSFYYLIKSLQKTEQSDLARNYFELYKKHNPDNLKAIKKMAALF